MKDIPIIFSAPMVQALLAGRKTMTRRLARWSKIGCECGILKITPSKTGQLKCPQCSRVDGFIRSTGPTAWQKAKPGDRLWVRESFNPVHSGDPTRGARYMADVGRDDMKWKPSIHMPRWASRITLDVTATKTEKLQAISEVDARAEGAIWHDGHGIGHSGWRHDPADGFVHGDARTSFCRLWLNLHGAKSWEANPEVVAMSFDVQQVNIDALQVAA